MGKAVPERWRHASGHFACVFQRLVDHRGLEAEGELIDSLGAERLKALYDGDEPRLGELIEAARILDVPLSTFQLHDRGAFSELEVAFAEVMYAAGDMDAGQRLRLVEELAALPARIQAGDAADEPSDAQLPETLLSIIRRAAE